VRIAHEVGVAIGSGSDLLAAAQPFKTTELVLKARLLGNMGALVSATRTNAHLFRMEDRIGTVEEGKWADLIVVQGNPVDDIAVLAAAENVKVVMKQGAVLKRLLAE
jgi:imidazolonepropionase-like amidohydrolase